MRIPFNYNFRSNYKCINPSVKCNNTFSIGIIFKHFILYSTGMKIFRFQLFTGANDSFNLSQLDDNSRDGFQMDGATDLCNKQSLDPVGDKGNYFA